jgi:hypothetical protein
METPVLVSSAMDVAIPEAGNIVFRLCFCHYKLRRFADRAQIRRRQSIKTLTGNYGDTKYKNVLQIQVTHRRVLQAEERHAPASSRID